MMKVKGEFLRWPQSPNHQLYDEGQGDFLQACQGVLNRIKRRSVTAHR